MWYVVVLTSALFLCSLLPLCRRQTARDIFVKHDAEYFRNYSQQDVKTKCLSFDFVFAS
jgi:hypothetical protein